MKKGIVPGGWNICPEIEHILFVSRNLLDIVRLLRYITGILWYNFGVLRYVTGVLLRDSGIIPYGSKNISLRNVNITIGSNNIPVGIKNIPCEGNNFFVNSKDIPFEGENIPHESTPKSRKRQKMDDNKNPKSGDMYFIICVVTTIVHTIFSGQYAELNNCIRNGDTK